MDIFTKSHLYSSLIGMAFLGLTTATQAVAISGQGSWETTLQGRDLDGNLLNGFEAYYDTIQNMTWLSDANYIKTAGINNTGLTNGSLKTITAYGISEWALPAATITYNSPCQWYNNGANINPTYGCNETVATIKQEESSTTYDNLFGNILGNKSSNGSSYSTVNTGPFSNVQQGEYLTNAVAWYENDGVAPKAVTFSTISGQLERRSISFASSYAMWTKAGDVGSVPEASTWALMVLGLAGIWMMRTGKLQSNQN
jgi:hypothetical protein